MSDISKYEPITCFDASECEYKKCPLYNFETNKCKLERLKPPRVPVGQQPQRQTEIVESPFAKLEAGKFARELKGKLVDDPVQRDVDTARGPTNVTNFRLTDGVTELRVAIWGELANEVMDYTAGTDITLLNMSIKEPYDGMIQVSSNRKTEIK